MNRFASIVLATHLGLVPFFSTRAVALGVTVSPTSLSFGNQVQGTTSPAKTVKLNNGQSVALTISKISVTTSDFAATSTGPIAHATLAPGRQLHDFGHVYTSSFGDENGNAFNC
jgi:hypothetical protein